MKPSFLIQEPFIPSQSLQYSVRSKNRNQGTFGLAAVEVKVIH